MLNATQGLSFRNLRSSDFIEKVLDIYRDQVKFLDNDRLLHRDIENSISFLQHIGIDADLL